MISTLEELRAYTAERAAAAPVIGDRVLLKEPGIDAAERARIEQSLPGLPGSYLDCAERFDLLGVELGSLGLAPRDFGGGTLADRLLTANGPANPFAGLLSVNAVYEVASFESTDPIGVVRADAAQRAGEVVWVDAESQRVPVVTPLAPDFATFLILAGRLYAAAIAGNGVDEVLGGTPVDAEQAAAWRVLGSMTLA